MLASRLPTVTSERPLSTQSRHKALNSRESAGAEVPKTHAALASREQSRSEAQKIVDRVGVVSRYLASHAVPRPGLAVEAVVEGHDLVIVGDAQVHAA